MLRYTITFLAVVSLSAVGPIFSQKKDHQATRVLAPAGEFKITSYDLRSRDTHWPLWSAGAMITWEKSGTASPVIHAFDATGQDSPTVFTIAGADGVNIYHVAHAADGTLALAGMAMDAERHRSSFIAWIAPDHQSGNTIRFSGYYWPGFVALGPDGTIWTAGWESSDASGYKKNFDAAVIRHFDRAGHLLDSLLPARSLSKATKDQLTALYGFMVSSPTRLGWMESGASYYEVSFDTKDVLEFPGVPIHGVGEILVGMALTDHGEVFASTSHFAGSDFPHGVYLYELDREHAQWQLVPLPPDSALRTEKYVFGAEGNNLVIPAKELGLHRFLHVE
jgi:hypothetical protein